MLVAGVLTLLSGAAEAQDDCTTAAKFIYVMTADRGLHRFNPLTNQFSAVGTISCPAQSGERPYSMAVRRDGTAYVVFTYGSMFAVDTQTAACTDIGFQRGQAGFTAFGMGFTLDSAGEDALYISTRSEIGGVGHQLGRVDLSTMTVTAVGAYDQVSGRAELTGSGEGKLYGAFEGTPFQLAEIRQSDAHILSTTPMTGADFSANSSNFAFAHWGGRFYLFAGPGNGTSIFRHDPADGTTQKVSQTPLTIVGAGVSTCAPTEEPDSTFSLDGDNGAGIAPPPQPPTMEQLQPFFDPPPPGPYAPGEDITVVGGVRDDSGALRPLDGGTFHVTDATGEVRDYPATPRDDGRITATVPLPSKDGPVSVSFTPTLALEPSESLAPSDQGALQLEVRWGLRWETDGLPATCYTNQPCEGTARLVRESPSADRILLAPQGRVVLKEDGQPVTADPFPADLNTPISFSRTYTTPRTVTWQPSARATTGEVDAPSHNIVIREPVVLQLPERLDFGTLTAGAATQQSCTALDMSGSSGLDGQTLQITPTGLDTGCESVVMLKEGGALREVTAPVTADASGLTFCLTVPFCSADAAPDGAALTIAATDPAFPDQKQTVSLAWSVTGRSWLSCNGVWFWPTLGGLAALFVVGGYLSPHRFPVGSHVVTAGSLKGLKRGSPVELRSASGGRAGFYRNARLGIHADGSVNGRTRGAVAILRATRRGVRLEPKGALEVYDKRRRRWEPPEQSGLMEPSPSEVFRVGELYFQIEPG